MATVNPNGIPTQSLDWGTLKWFVSPAHTAGAAMAFIAVGFYALPCKAR